MLLPLHYVWMSQENNSNDVRIWNQMIFIAIFPIAVFLGCNIYVSRFRKYWFLQIWKSACFDQSLLKNQCSEDEAKMIIKSLPVNDSTDTKYKSITPVVPSSNFEYKYKSEAYACLFFFFNLTFRSISSSPTR